MEKNGKYWLIKKVHKQSTYNKISYSAWWLKTCFLFTLALMPQLRTKMNRSTYKVKIHIVIAEVPYVMNSSNLKGSSTIRLLMSVVWKTIKTSEKHLWLEWKAEIPGVQGITGFFIMKLHGKNEEFFWFANQWIMR